MIVLLDTNFIMLPEQFGIDIFAEIKNILPSAELKTIRQVVDELKSLGTKEAATSLKLLDKKNIKIIEKTGKADDILMQVAKEQNAAIATNDRELKKKAEKNKIKVIFMRSKKKLEISGGESLV